MAKRSFFGLLMQILFLLYVPCHHSCVNKNSFIYFQTVNIHTDEKNSHNSVVFMQILDSGPSILLLHLNNIQFSKQLY